jgi:hypothetical protein
MTAHMMRTHIVHNNLAGECEVAGRRSLDGEKNHGYEDD